MAILGNYNLTSSFSNDIIQIINHCHSNSYCNQGTSGYIFIAIMQESRPPSREQKNLLLTVDLGSKSIPKDRVGEQDERNQDALRLLPNLNTAIVCDGVGSGRKGADSALLAAETLANSIADSVGQGRAAANLVLPEALIEAHRMLKHRSKMDETQLSSAAIAARIVVNERGELTTHVAQAGDCRAYIFTGSGELIPTSLDDTPKIRSHPTPEEQRQFQKRVRNFSGSIRDASRYNGLAGYFGGGPLGGHVINQALGPGKVARNRKGFEQLQPDTYIVPMNYGDKIILASDGLDNLTDGRIEELLNKYRHLDSNQLADVLATEAYKVSQLDRNRENPNQLARAKKDDITVVVMSTHGGANGREVVKGAGGPETPGWQGVGQRIKRRLDGIFGGTSQK